MILCWGSRCGRMRMITGGPEAWRRWLRRVSTSARGYSGVMEAISKGAHDAGDWVVGMTLNSRLLQQYIRKTSQPGLRASSGTDSSIGWLSPFAEDGPVTEVSRVE
jgi:hypothetical protein